MTSLLTMIGGLFILMLLGLPLSFTIISVSITSLLLFTDLPIWVFMQRFYAGLDSFVLVAIPFFLLTGNLMNEGKVTNRLIDFAYACVGHIKAGLAQVNIMVSLLFGGISGSAVADVSGVGSVLIPAMIKKGYSKSFAVAITSTSSTLGQVIPPSIIMIVYAASAGTSVGALFLAGVVPGILIAAGLMLLSYFYAIKHGYPSENNFSLQVFWRTLKKALLPLGAPLLIIGGIVGGIFTATEASVVAVLYCLFITMVIDKTITVMQLPRIIISTAKMSGLTLFCIGAASMFGWLMGYFQVNNLISSFLSEISVHQSILLLIFVGIFLALGTFMDSVPAIIIFVPIVAPIAAASGIDPVHLGIVISVALAFGLVTPPYGLCLLLGASIAKIPAQETFKDLFIGLTCIILILLFLVFFPSVSLYLPRLIMPDLM